MKSFKSSATVIVPRSSIISYVVSSSRNTSPSSPTPVPTSPVGPTVVVGPTPVPSSNTPVPSSPVPISPNGPSPPIPVSPVTGPIIAIPLPPLPLPQASWNSNNGGFEYPLPGVIILTPIISPPAFTTTFPEAPVPPPPQN